MKIFLSHSGELSHGVACALGDWLPKVIQSIKPYVSSEIDKGARWSADIAQELEESSFGIVCITKDNMSELWINFEAGALSKTFGASRVCPFLFNVKHSELKGPLVQFQATKNEKADIFKLILSINNALLEENRLEEEIVSKTFEVWWPEIEEQLSVLEEKSGEPISDKTSTETEQRSEILEELLGLARDQQRLLTSPDTLLPRGYLLDILGGDFTSNSREMYRIRRAIMELRMGINVLSSNLVELEGNVTDAMYDELSNSRKQISRALAMLEVFLERDISVRSLSEPPPPPPSGPTGPRPPRGYIPPSGPTEPRTPRGYVPPSGHRPPAPKIIGKEEGA